MVGEYNLSLVFSMWLVRPALVVLLVVADVALGAISHMRPKQFLQAESAAAVPQVSNRSKKSSGMSGGSCKDESILEHIVDKLAFTLFIEPPQDIDHANINVGEMLRSLEAQGIAGIKAHEQALDECTHARLEGAAARMQSWVDAVARSRAAEHARATDHVKKHNIMPHATKGSKNTTTADSTFQDDFPLHNPAGSIEKKVLPTPCASDLPADDPYWSQIDPYQSCKKGVCDTYNECRYSDGCKRKFTNLERVDSIRATARATYLFLKQQNVTNMLFGGSVIGSYRCQDVLPWDLDADVAVLQWHFEGLLKLLDQPEGSGWKGYGRATDLKRFGIPGFTLMEKHPGCMPLVVVDQATGFFTDVWPMEHLGMAFFSPWQDGTVGCDASRFFAGCAVTRCDHWSAKNTLPTSVCRFAGHDNDCAHDLKAFLYEYYGPSVEKPDVPTRK